MVNKHLITNAVLAAAITFASVAAPLQVYASDGPGQGTEITATMPDNGITEESEIYAGENEGENAEEKDLSRDGSSSDTSGEPAEADQEKDSEEENTEITDEDTAEDIKEKNAEGKTETEADYIAEDTETPEAEGITEDNRGETQKTDTTEENTTDRDVADQNIAEQDIMTDRDAALSAADPLSVIGGKDTAANDGEGAVADPNGESKVEIKTGLVKDEDGLRFYNEDGTAVSDKFIESDGSFYYFGKDGLAASGIYENDGKSYFFDPSEEKGVKIGKFTSEGLEYCADESGALLRGWQKEDGGIAFYGSDYSRFFGKDLTLDGSIFHFNGSGILAGCELKDLSSLPGSYSGKVVYNSGEYYYKDGLPLKGWHAIDGKTLYLSSSGAVSHGLTKTDKGTFYFDSKTGEAVKGRLIKNSGKTYYAGEDGRLSSGLISIEGKKYLFGQDFVMKTGWQKVNGSTYYFGADGQLKTGWQTINGARYYLSSKGEPQTGWRSINGRLYNFDNTGKMSTGWKIINGKRFYFYDRSYVAYSDAILGARASGWKTIGGKKYYFMDTRCKAYNGKNQGTMATGFKTIGGKTFYFIDNRASTVNKSNYGSLASGIIKLNGKNIFYFQDGIMRKKEGWARYNGKYYYISSNGKAKTGWFKKGKNTYYMGSDGAMRTGWTKVGSKWYYMEKTGKMHTGWLSSGGRKYYLTKSGAMKTGWLKIDGKWYYVNPDRSLKKGWYTENGKKYYLTPSGARRTGWMSSGGKLYFFGTDGVMKTGWIKSGNKTLYLSSNGVLKKNTASIIGNKIYYFNKNGIVVPAYTHNASAFKKLTPKARAAALKTIYAIINNKRDYTITTEPLNRKTEFDPMVKAINDTYFRYYGDLGINPSPYKDSKIVNKVAISGYYTTEWNTKSLKKNAEIESLITKKFNNATSYNRSPWDQVEDITKYICRTFCYDYDSYYNGGTSWDTYATIKKGTGVCWNYAQYFYWMCQKGNIPCRLIGGTADGGAHEWNQVKLGGNWYYIDVCWVDAPDWDYYLSRNLWGDHHSAKIDQQFLK